MSSKPAPSARVTVVVGTRPEAIKLAPVVRALSALPGLEVRLVSTGQHREMLADALAVFGLAPDADLRVMAGGNGLGGNGTGGEGVPSGPAALSATCARMLAGLADDFAAVRPDLVLVHGDTSTTLAGALAGFHARTPVGHVEAGLRTGDMDAPWPEEGNRKLVAAVASVHYAPTARSRDALIAEHVDPAAIRVTGNTVIDALRLATERLDADAGDGASDGADGAPARTPFEGLGVPGLDLPADGRRLILVTGHRRESFGRGFEDICTALARLAHRDDVRIVYPVHLNPAVSEPVGRLLGEAANVHLIPPQGYLPFVALMRASHLIVTDSGGVQEEAPSLGVPVLVMRDTTERPEAVDAGTVRLVGTDPDRIVREASCLLDEPDHRAAMARATNPYGDGLAAARIVADVAARLGLAAPSNAPVPEFA